MAARVTPSCDGDHAMPPCSDPNCWHNDPDEVVSQGVESVVDRSTGEYITFFMEEWKTFWQRPAIGGTNHQIDLPEALPQAYGDGDKLITFNRRDFMEWFQQPSMQASGVRHQAPGEVDAPGSTSEPEEEPKSKKGNILLRLRPEVRKLVHAAAEEEGLSDNVWAERVLFEAALRATVKHEYSKPMKQAEREVFAPAVTYPTQTPMIWQPVISGGSGYPRGGGNGGGAVQMTYTAPNLVPTVAEVIEEMGGEIDVDAEGVVHVTLDPAVAALADDTDFMEARALPDPEGVDDDWEPPAEDLFRFD